MCAGEPTANAVLPRTWECLQTRTSSSTDARVDGNVDLAFCITALLAGFCISYSQLVSCLLTCSCILTPLFKHAIYMTLQMHVIIILQISAYQELPARGVSSVCSHLDAFPEVQPPRVCEQTKAEPSPSRTWEQLNGHSCLSSPVQWRPPPPARAAAADQPPSQSEPWRKGPVRRCPTPLPGRGRLREPSLGEQRVSHARSG